MPGYPPQGQRPAGPLVSPPVTEADTLLPDGGEVQTSVDTEMAESQLLPPRSCPSRELACVPRKPRLQEATGTQPGIPG